MSETTEKILVEQAKSDPDAFLVLYDRYVERILTFAYRQTGNQTLAQDITSATFEKALKHIGRYRWRGISFCAWLYKIARNEIRQHYRRHRFWAPLSPRQPSGMNVELIVQTGAEFEQLHLALKALSAADQELITLRFFEELSSTEVATVVGCSTNPFYVRLHRALNRLRQQIISLSLPTTDLATEEVNIHVS